MEALLRRPRELLARSAWRLHPVRPGPLYALLRESQWWPEERLRGLQVELLRDVLDAAAHVPFYRERLRAAGLAPSALRSVEDLGALPPLEREQLQREGIERLRVPGRWGIPMETSGSTGRPVKVVWPVEMMSWFEAEDRRCNEWHGGLFGERRVQVATSPAAKRLRRRVNYRVGNVTMIHCSRLDDPRVVHRLADSLGERPPGIVWGVSNALYAFALALLEEGRAVRARACWSEGNHLHAHYVAPIEQAFGCPVYQRYGSSEIGVVAHQCSAGGLHVSAESAIVEVVREDGSPAAPGELGEVLVTVLRNRAMPLLRYRIGDLAEAPTGDACPCGRTLPLLGTIVGRANELLLRGDGCHVVPELVSWLVESQSESVLEFQVIQHEDLRLTVRVVQRDGRADDEVRARLAAGLDELVRLPGATTVERVVEIPLTGAGKLRHIVSQATAQTRPDDVVAP